MWILFGGPTPIHLFPATTGHSASQNARPGTNSTGFRFHRKGVASASWRTPAWVGHDLHGGNQGKNGDIFLENEHALKKGTISKGNFFFQILIFRGYVSFRNRNFIPEFWKFWKDANFGNPDVVLWLFTAETWPSPLLSTWLLQNHMGRTIESVAFDSIYSRTATVSIASRPSKSGPKNNRLTRKKIVWLICVLTAFVQCWRIQNECLGSTVSGFWA